MPRYDLSDYVPVQERINEFWRDHPNGRIVTHLASDPEDFKACRYRAEVYRDVSDTESSATGWAFEVAGGGGANATSHEENCETSCIGRALANLGYAASHKQRPSREEMEKTERMEPEDRQRVEAQHERNTAPRPMSLPATRAKPEPNGAEEQRKRLVAAAAVKGILLPDDQSATEWADILDVQFEILDSDFRVDRARDGSVTGRALQNAILALPALVEA